MFNFTFTQENLRQIIGNNTYLKYWYDSLCEVCPDYDINTKERLAAFLAQCAHESANFKILRENLNYRASSLVETFPKYFPSIQLARQYEKKPEKIANRVYADRMGNRNEESGDGWRYMGRGLIQLTGKENYQWFAASIDMQVDDLPEYMMTFSGAVQSACFFWENNNINKYADSKDIVGMTRAINGGDNGLDDRISKYKLACKILGSKIVMLEYIPNFIIDNAIHISLGIGLIATIVTLLFNDFLSKTALSSALSKIAFILGIGCLICGSYLNGYRDHEEVYKKQVAELEVKVQLANEKSQEVKTIIKERIVVKKKLIKAKTKHIMHKIDNPVILKSDCVIPQEAIDIHNEAADIAIDIKKEEE